ncbi:MAG: gamma-glutamyl-gamma-aminobutyrate hydrolase family protein, partial [Myxococcales bacterium]
LQFINTHFGGSLTQDLASHQRIEDRHVASSHAVQLVGALAEALGRSLIEVNSFHNHGVLEDDLAPALEPLAFAGGRLVEALRHRALPVLAVQWHPERRSVDSSHVHGLVQRWLREGRLA